MTKASVGQHLSNWSGKMVGVMNMKTTTQKAEGLLNTPGLSQGEKQFLQSILEFLEQAKEDPKPDVALAARKWESSLIYRIRVSLQRRTKFQRCLATDATGAKARGINIGNAVEALAGSQVPIQLHEFKEAA